MTQPPNPQYPNFPPSGPNGQQPQWGAPNQPAPAFQPGPPQPNQWQQPPAPQAMPPQGPPPQQHPGQQYPPQQHPGHQAPPQQWQQPPMQHQQPGHPQQGQHQPSPLGTGAYLNIHTGFFPLAFILFLTGPLIVIDGVEVGRSWGNLSLELSPGVHTIHIHTRYLWAIGKADMQFQIAPGQQLNARYETPLWAFSAGTILFH